MHSAYDEPVFFEKYRHMSRSEQGLEGAGEWHALRCLLPVFDGKRVLDLGCGFGWHCRYAAEQGARSVLGIDLSERMLREAARRTDSPVITYRRCAIEDYAYPPDTFDIVLSSLALHYVADFAAVCRGVRQTLTAGGSFVFSIEHPVFTAQGPQEWDYDAAGDIRHWPVDRYFEEGAREAVFLGEPVEKQHHTLTTLLDGLLRQGFLLQSVVDQPAPHLSSLPGMAEELRRPMMLLIAARRP